MSTNIDFVHLNVHSEYSIYDSVINMDALLSACQKQKMPAVALTDLNNLFGTIKFYKKAIQKGIKPILGAEVWCLQEDAPPSRFVLLCQNQTGLDGLRRLLSRGYLKAERDPIPIVPYEWLCERQEGLIAILLEDKSMQLALEQNEMDIAKQKLDVYKQAFIDRFYLSVSSIKPNQSVWQDIVKLAGETDTPVVATNPVCFISKTDYEAHEARVCIQEGTTLAAKREKRFTEEQYFKTPEQMAALFKSVPSALTNSVEIAKRCNVSLTLGEAYLPAYPVPEGDTIESFLEEESKRGLKHRWEKIQKTFKPGKEVPFKEYEDRLQLELGVINTMGFPGYFLIVADFIRWAKHNDIPVGPGRGSGAGSLVAYALDITDLDPIQYDLLFERFLNPERVSMPDFDVDFCMENRDRVIEYVAQHYGKRSVSQIATFGTMAAKAVIRDVGRVLGHPYGFVDAVAKLIPFEIGMTLDKALVEEETLRKRYKSEEEVRLLINLAKKLEGLTRNVGKHAGGVVIAPSRLTEYTPLYCEQGTEQIVTQYDKDDVEAIGLVKFDFLGLRTLTIIHWAVQIANRTLDEKINIADIPLDCPKTYELLKACKTTAVFQLESRGMKDLIHRLQPDEFEEIIALVALFRPGPLQSGMVDDFIDRKHGRAIVEYPHPELEPILKPTYGVILYQEQVMQIAQVLAGYSLGAADLLRRAMGKKKPEEMAKQRKIFVDGATQRGVEEETATSIFDLMEKFAGYGFNKSHSAAYALVSYQTAWLKTHYPSAFMAAVLSSDMNHTDKVVIFIQEVKKMGLDWLHPDVNHSFYRFALDKNAAIVYGLGAIKGVGEGAIQSIVDARALDGPFKDLFDFCKRVDCRKANKRVLDALIKSGAMDSFNVPRHTMLASIESAIKLAEKQNQDLQSGQGDMFAQSSSEEPKWVEGTPIHDDLRLKYEKDTLGFYLSGHPIASLKGELCHFVTHSLNELPRRELKVVVAGIICALRTLVTKKGDRMAFVTLDDNSEPFEVAIFSDLYQKRRERLVKDEVLIVTGTLNYDTETQQLRLRAEDIYDLPNARSRYAKRLRVKVKGVDLKIDNLIGGLSEMMREQRGDCHVALDYETTEFKARLNLGQDWQVLPSNYLIETIKEHLGEDALALEY